MSPITRREFLGKVAGAAAVATALPAAVFAQGATISTAKQASALTPSGKKRRNVLFFMSDDMRVELGCYDSMFSAHTPNLDALAKSGVRFDRNYCQFPLCNPSRASLMTARRPTLTGVLGNRANFRELHPDWISLPQLFKENGYTTLRTGKIFHGGIDDPKAWNVGYGATEGDGSAGGHKLVIPREAGPAAPADVQSPLTADASRADHSDQIIVLDGKGEGHPDWHTATTAIEYLNKYKDQPFFIGCGFVKPHSPPCAPQEFLDLYPVDKIKLTPDFAPWPTVPPGIPSAAIRKRNADLFIGRAASESEAKQVIQAYVASITYADYNLGRVVAELDRLGLRENTIMVFAVDHGYQLGEKGKWSKAGSLFEMGARVPLMIVDPPAKGNGQSCYRIVESLDIYRTMAELCELPVQEGCEGKSLVPLLNDPKAEWDRPAYTVWSEDGATLHGVGVRNEQYRYTEFGKDAANGAMLFDQKADPLEMKNLAEDPKFGDVKAKLSPLVREYAASLKPPAPAAAA